MALKNLFYNVKPLIPRKFQIFLRRQLSNYKREKYRHVWPIDPSAGRPPENWPGGWSENKRFAVVLSHDVDTQKGFDNIPKVLTIEKNMGFKSAFNIVPEKYRISQEMIDYIKAEGFEINVHGLKHDGKLFKSRAIFNERAVIINDYLEHWGAIGFTAPSMICNADWIHDLNINHSISTFDTDPFEPRPIPARTIFPFLVQNEATGKSYIEMPYTLPQDHSLFIILKENDISIWKQKLSWIAEKGGMALLNTHPDYIRFENSNNCSESYPGSFYIDFLKHIKKEYKELYWNAIPSDIACYYRSSVIKSSQHFQKN